MSTVRDRLGVGERRAFLRVTALMLAFVGLAYVTATNSTNGDSKLSFPTAHSIVHEGDLDLDEFDQRVVTGAHGHREIDGRGFDFYPWTVALFAVPSVVAFDAAHAVGIGPGAMELVDRDQMTYVQIANGAAATLLAVGVVMALAYLVAPGDERARRRVAVLVSLGFALGTAAWSVTSRSLWQHGPSMLFGGLALIAAVRLDDGRSRRWGPVLGAALAAAYAIRPTNAVLVVALGLWVVIRHRQALASVAAGAVAVTLPWVAVNVATFGSTLPPYHDGGQLDVADLSGEAMAGHLFDPGRGLIAFSPIVLLAVPGAWLALRGRPEAGRLHAGLAAAAAAAIVGQWLVVSMWAVWWGGHTYGPRLLADALPWLALLCVPAVTWLCRPAPASRARRGAIAATTLALGWSIFVHAQGAYMRTTLCADLEPPPYPERAWAFDDPQFLAGVSAIGDVPFGSLFTEPCSRILDQTGDRRVALPSPHDGTDRLGGVTGRGR